MQLRDLFWVMFPVVGCAVSWILMFRQQHWVTSGVISPLTHPTLSEESVICVWNMLFGEKFKSEVLIWLQYLF